MSIPRTKTFCEVLVRENQIDSLGFSWWVFHPGMLFGATIAWWGKGEKRKRPHEGLDFCLYADRRGGTARLLPGTKIPAMHEGTVVRIIGDYLGKSIILDHGPARTRENCRVCSVYGHTQPAGDVYAGKPVAAGDVLGYINGALSPGSKILPHLHVSIGYKADTLSYDDFDWKSLNERSVTFLDPLPLLEGDYAVLEHPDLSFLHPFGQ